MAQAPKKKKYVLKDHEGKEHRFDAERAERGEGTQVTFYNGDEPVASFINSVSWYVDTSSN